jgi:hypothetical protein
LRIFIWLVYSVDIKTEWVDVMNTYTDKDILILDDIHLLTDEVIRERYNICPGNPPPLRRMGLRRDACLTPVI